MSFQYSQNVLDCLRGLVEFDIYLFIDILLDKDGVTPNLYLTTYPVDITLASASPPYTPVNYIADYIKGVSPPARSGSITQEIQRIEIAQGLSSDFVDAPVDIIARLGNNFHNAPVLFRALVEIAAPGSTVITADSVASTDGIIKGINRSQKDDSVVIEFSNSFGKLEQINELRTTPGSLKRRNPDDTSFDRAHLEAKYVMQNWGGNPSDDD